MLICVFGLDKSLPPSSYNPLASRLSSYIRCHLGWGTIAGSSGKACCGPRSHFRIDFSVEEGHSSQEKCLKIAKRRVGQDIFIIHVHLLMRQLY